MNCPIFSWIEIDTERSPELLAAPLCSEETASSSSSSEWLPKRSRINWLLVDSSMSISPQFSSLSIALSFLQLSCLASFSSEARSRQRSSRAFVERNAVPRCLANTWRCSPLALKVETSWPCRHAAFCMVERGSLPGWNWIREIHDPLWIRNRILNLGR